MTTAGLAAQILADHAALEALVAPLDDAAVGELVEHFKSEADRHWWINANRSLEFAELITRIGRQRNGVRHIALGTMARGDALKYLGNLQEAWDELERAGEMFLRVGDEVGWARTRIGKLGICIELERVTETLSEAEKARSIFELYSVHEKRFRLDLNLGLIFHHLGDQAKAIAIYTNALSYADSLGIQKWESVISTNVSLIHTNLGMIYEKLGSFQEALFHHEHALSLLVRRNEERGIALAEFNIAHIKLAQGKYTQALRLLYRVYNHYIKEGLEADAVNVSRDIVECYIALNRYEEGRDLAKRAIEHYQLSGAAYSKGITLLHLARAELGLKNIDLAKIASSSASSIFMSLNLPGWIAIAQLYQGLIAIKQKSFGDALDYAKLAAESFNIRDEQIDYASAIILHSQAILALGDVKMAAESAKLALKISRKNNVFSLRFGAYLLLGQAAERQGFLPRARRYYTAAVATTQRIQSMLTSSLRTDFLEDKGEALQALLNLYLREGNNVLGFEALERTKSQVLLGYLANRDELRWSQESYHCRDLIDELNRLREEHHWFYQLAQDHPTSEDDPGNLVTPDQARIELFVREKRMRAITEQLYLQGGDSVVQVKPPKLCDVQKGLSDNELLIEFYNDGSVVWAFTVDNYSLEVLPLPLSQSEIDHLLAQLQSNIGFALGSGSIPPMAQRLTGVAQRILGKLHAALIAPLQQRMHARQRLVIVPYGALHYLPFHLLHDGSSYLIEQHEIVILPAAGLITRRGPSQSAGALVLAHSWGNLLPNTQLEAQLVIDMVGGGAYSEEAARRKALSGKPTQILHIAAHGQHRLDQPDLSFIELADGQLYTDDLLQLDMSYELVVLSACETGKAKVAAGDELIGLGRGFLYAGAGALVASLWRVTDGTTLALMERFYAGLRAGVSKAAALRDAQLMILAEQPDLHPAFWGAFQLVGDARPLTEFAEGAQVNAEPLSLMTADLT